MARNNERVYWHLSWREEHPTEAELQPISMRFEDEAAAKSQYEKLIHGVGPLDITNGSDHKFVHGAQVRDPQLKRVVEPHIPSARELGLQHESIPDEPPKPHGSPILDPWGNDQSF